MFGLGLTEVLVVLAVAILLFAARLPAVLGWCGRSVREFWQGSHALAREVGDTVQN